MEDNRLWSVDILKSWRLGDLWIYHCFPYYTDGQSPPYPGFEHLKIWLNMNYDTVAYEAVYRDGQSALEVTFNNAEDAMLFRLAWA